MITRAIKESIIENITINRKIVVVYGPRQVGKTTLIHELIKELKLKTFFANADEIKHHNTFSSRDLRTMMEVIDDAELLFIDEAQNIDNIGINLKILFDGNPDLKIIVSGSSSFDLTNKLQEPLTGRTITYKLFPISIGELRNDHSIFDLKERKEDYLLYGMYPEVQNLNNKKSKIEALDELTRSYLYKDILQLANIKHSNKLRNLLQLLALQICSTASVNKLSNALDLSSETVNNYLDLLEKTFVIYRLPGYSKNLSKEISKMDKFYFYDNGIRNALLSNFNPLELRNDAGQLWENFIIMERMKKLAYTKSYASSYFWRTYSGAEIDYIEDKDGTLNGFEIKYGKKIAKVPKTWSETYKNSTFTTINKDNWVDWTLIK